MVRSVVQAHVNSNYLLWAANQTVPYTPPLLKASGLGSRSLDITDHDRNSQLRNQIFRSRYKLHFAFFGKSPEKTPIQTKYWDIFLLIFRARGTEALRDVCETKATVIQVHNLLSEILKTEKLRKLKVFFMEVDSNLNTTVTMTTMTSLKYPVLQDPEARCNVPLLHVYVQVYSLVWTCLCLKFYWMFYLKIKITLIILWSVFIPLKINNAMNNIYQLVPISCTILSLSSWPLIPLTK
jgi:hypothetical protein